MSLVFNIQNNVLYTRHVGLSQGPLDVWGGGWGCAFFSDSEGGGRLMLFLHPHWQTFLILGLFSRRTVEFGYI